jgi:hypothetical protein
MKCTSCGLPLSPSRTNTNCPRCGTPISSGQKGSSTPVQQFQQAYWGNAGFAQPGAGTPLPNNQWAQTAQSSPYNTPPPQMPGYQPGVQQQFPQQMPQQGAQPGQMWFQGPVSQPGFAPGTTLPPQANPPRYSRNTKLGFTVAGLCVLTGGLILIVVYFLAIGLPGGSPNSPATASNTPTGSIPTTAPTATTALSPTATIYPGQQYIYNAQMASAIDPNSFQPTQLTTTFKTNQKVYVTFQLHPTGQSGAICLLWYLNGSQAFHYSFSAGANSKLSYAWFTYGQAGTAYVELYWASTTQCTDKILAQHVDFTVTN